MKPSKSDTWMPFYVTDYLGDTMHLETVQHGAYLLLLLACWKNGGTLPDDDAQLATISRLPRTEWRKHSAVLRRFFSIEGDCLLHGRVRAEWEKAKALSDKRKAVGKAGGRPPNAKQTETNRFPVAIPNAEPNDKANAKQTETPSPSPSNTSVPNGTGGKPPLEPVDNSPPSGLSDPDYIWSQGVPYLTAAGVKEGNSRSMLGGLVKTYGASQVRTALESAIKENPVAPVAWIQATLLATGAGKKAKTSHQGFENIDYSQGVREDGTLV